MRRTTAVLGTSALALGVVAVAVAGPAPAITRAETLRLTATVDRQTTLDFHARGFSLGDQRIAAGSLADERGAVVGRFDLACTVTDTLAEGTFQCLFTLALPHGQVTSQGLASTVGPRSTTAVTGGTGRYQNVRGQVVVTRHSPTRATLVVSLLP